MKILLQRLVTAHLLLLPLLLAGQTKKTATANTTNRNSQPIKLNRVVVIAQQIKRPENQPEALTVIKRHEIIQSGARSVAELLKSQEGVHIEQYGGLGQMATVSLRGNGNARILVMINGIPINPAQGGGVDFSSLSIDNIQRVEIIRGGASALYGENAFGGVINIITRTKAQKHPQIDISLSYGSYNTKIFHSSAAFRFSHFKFSPFFSLGESDGGYSFPGQATQKPSGEYQIGGEKVKYLNSGFSSWKGGFQLEYNHPKNGINSWLYFQRNHKNAGVPGTIDFPTTSAAQKDTKTILSLQVVKNKINLLGDDELFFRVYTIYQERYYRDFDLFSSDDRHYNRAWGTMAHLNSKIKKQKLKIGVEYRNDYLDSTKFTSASGTDSSAAEKDVFSLYTKAELYINKMLTIIPALRFDYHTLHPDALSPKIGLLLDLSGEKKIILKANFGHSYRPPSFSDLFWSETFFAAGNKDLQPEKCWTGDIGMLFRPFQFLRGNIFFFFSFVRDMIIWQPSAGGVWRPSNIGETTIHGIETELRTFLSLPSLQTIVEINLNYTLQYVTDKTSGITEGNQLPRQPYEKANFSTTFTFAKLGFLRVSANYLGFRFINIANTKYLGDYLLFDCNLGINLPAGFSVTFSIRNLFDTSYIHFREYPVPGREFSIKLQYRFR